MIDTSMLFLIFAGSLFVVGIILLAGGNDSNSKGKEKKGSKTFDANYPVVFNEIYLKTGNIRETVQQLEDHYENNPYMKKLIAKSLDYLNGDYGDYETALSLINEQGDEKIEDVHEEAIRLETAKTLGLPGC